MISSKPQTEDAFLPTTAEDLKARGWEEIDILLINGDAYIDHPAFGAALIGRHLESQGFRVGMIAQPRWDCPDDLMRLGRPRLFAGISAGNLDSMLNKLTAQQKVRSEDAYSPGGEINLRPNRATIVYSNLVRQAFKGLPVVIGGIEASLRRLAHYDYWSDQVRRSILLDSKADLLIFGMAERPVVELAQRLDRGESIEAIKDIRGTAFMLKKAEQKTLEYSERVGDQKVLALPSYQDVKNDRFAFSKMSRLFQRETNPYNARPLVQEYEHAAVYFNPPAFPLETEMMDALYDLPFARKAHPSYQEKIPAFETIKDSVVTMRGCFGGCSFCSITEHEGRIIQSRSKENILKEIRLLSERDGFRGTISDVGGPTANMYRMGCKDKKTEAACRRLSCVHPKICKNLKTDHQPLIDLLAAIRREKGIKHSFIASGIRYDLAERSPEFIEDLARYHTGGQLSVAPEHVDDDVLAKMKKPGIESYEAFANCFMDKSAKANKKQFLVPYYISGHPGSTLESMIKLALYLKKKGIRPRQVQDFIPTPMSMATSMYYTGLDPENDQEVYVAKTLREKKLQKALLMYWDQSQHHLAKEALRKAKRSDLIKRLLYS